MPEHLFVRFGERHSDFPNDSVMLERIRAFDWSGSSVGPIETWPDEIRSAVRMTLLSESAMAVLIGSDGIPMGKLKEKLWKYALTSGRVERAFNQLQSQVSAKQTDLPWDKAQENTARPSGNATRAIMPPARFLPAAADDTES